MANILFRKSEAYSDLLIYGSFQSYVVGIIVPDQEVLESWALAKKIPGDFAQLCENEVTSNGE